MCAALHRSCTVPVGYQHPESGNSARHWAYLALLPARQLVISCLLVAQGAAVIEAVHVLSFEVQRAWQPQRVNSSRASSCSAWLACTVDSGGNQHLRLHAVQVQQQVSCSNILMVWSWYFLEVLA
jgi:hypothetical protein